MRTPSEQIEDFSEVDDALTDEALDRHQGVSGYTTPAACHSRRGDSADR